MIIAGNEVTEGSICLIHFIDGGETKWGHALIDSIDQDKIRFRTAVCAKQMEVKVENVLDIGADENVLFDEETVKALYRGELYVDSKKSMEWPEFE